MRVNLARPVSMAISNGRLYWADRALKRVFSSALSDAKTSEPTTEVSHIEDLVDLSLFDVAAQPSPPAGFACRQTDALKRTRCDQLCFSSPRDRQGVCACATGILNLQDQRSCVEPPTYLLYQDGAQIKSANIEPDANGASQSAQPLAAPLAPIDGLKAFDYDSAEQKFYAYFDRLVNPSIGWFHQTDVSTQNVRDVITGKDSLPDSKLPFREAVDLKIDWRTFKVYWTSGASGKVYSAYTDGSQYATLAVG